jgi:23S rRNA (pseudouridine1915-N3)-methyltransferase
MRIVIAAIGKLRKGPEQELFDTYVKRLPWSVTVKDFAESGAGQDRRDREGERLLKAVPSGATIVALDEHGTALDSVGFADRLKGWRDGGIGDVAFLIGGADGHSEEVRKKADLLLSFGPMTWPHLMVRGMLAEQLYRASTILSGHPYHRA